MGGMKRKAVAPASDPAWEGLLFIAVRTTGIFCRPGCPARKPLPKNVEHFRTAREAIEAGYRACKRCRPLHAVGERPEWVARLIARVESAPDVPLKSGDLRVLGVDPARARRWFMAHYGMTFSAWCRSRRLAGGLDALRRGGKVDDAVFDSGYQSHSGFREAFAKAFGATPGKGDSVAALTMDVIDSPLGPLMAAADDAGLALLEFTDRNRIGSQLEAWAAMFGRPLVPGKHPLFEPLSRQLVEYFEGRRQRFDLPLVIAGTPFQERVWNALLTIPYGEVRSYRDIARSIGSPQAVRAVGRANGTNRISIIVPCHRVIGADGSIVGYGGGPRRKEWLLALERGERTLF
jgi:AraC family transcriptional regulator of adaptative response/methylated-DNA-[protein]-cysteine methyltransferase